MVKKSIFVDGHALTDIEEAAIELDAEIRFRALPSTCHFEPAARERFVEAQKLCPHANMPQLTGQLKEYNALRDADARELWMSARVHEHAHNGGRRLSAGVVASHIHKSR